MSKMPDTPKDVAAHGEQCERMQAILAATSDGMIVLDPTGRVELINQAAAQLLGSPAEDLLGEPVDVVALLGLDEEPENGVAIEVIRSEPEHRVYIVRMNRIMGLDGEGAGHVISAHDITAEREAAVMKNEFVSMVSHELRTPLTSIKGYVDLVAEGDAGEINEMQKEFLTIVQENSDRLVALINDILDISRIESGRVHLKVDPLEVPELIQGVIETFRTYAKSSDVQLMWVSEEPMPRAAGDRDRIGQVLMNLVSNAIKYSPGGGSVTVRARQDGEQVVVSVHDTGIGIALEDQEQLFSKFYRVDSSLTRDIGGTGLGLSICKSVVELLGGDVGCESEPGEGSTFWFTLPIASCELVRKPELEGPLDSAGGLVLVIDRDPNTCDLIGTYLRKRGYDVEYAHDAADAHEKALRLRPRAITLDVMLEEEDGFELLHQLKEDPDTRDIPVVVLSVVCDEGRSLRLGAADYLEKPIDHERLTRVVDDLIGGQDAPLVLVVDDDRDIVGVMSNMLRAKGFSTIAAYDGQEAMAAISEHRPDLVLLDLHMPVMDGYQVMQEVKSNKDTRDIPIVVMTAYRIDRNRTDLLALAADQLHKPFAVEDLVERVEQYFAEEG
ncbi:MAG: response regulator [Coriobacteriia bacterium]|jgi:PAS domain S-box-containing protein|nr:response regulator [Coriobacteriia bacterium]